MKKKLLIIAASLLGLASVFAAVNSGFPFANQQWTGYGNQRGVVQWIIGATAAGNQSDFYPGVNNSNNIGTSALRPATIYTTALNVSGATTQTGNLNLSGGLTLFNSTAPRTANNVASIYTTYSPSTGTLFYDSTDAGLCFSTGLVQSSIVAATAPTTACGH